jgi:hypothetical protein
MRRLHLLAICERNSELTNLRWAHSYPFKGSGKFLSCLRKLHFAAALVARPIQHSCETADNVKPKNISVGER